jgi:hypothetical protein
MPYGTGSGTDRGASPAPPSLGPKFSSGLQKTQKKSEGGFSFFNVLASRWLHTLENDA